MTQRMARVVCTIGPASSNPEVIGELIDKGLNVARLNFSHGTHDTHRETIRTVRSIAKEKNTYVGILQDLCGPKIRLGILPDNGVKINAGEEIALISGTDCADDALPVSYENLHEEVEVGESILLADGMIELIVKRIVGKKIICNPLNNGVVFSRKGVNMPYSNLKVSAFSEKDRADLLMGLDEEVDFVALSFVRNVADLKEIKEVIKNAKYKPKLIAKIEKPQAVKNLDKILDHVDGVMVARGDLGVEVPLENVPILQKEIIKAANDKGKIVITATQMLMSMVSSPRPTRGETSDVANAILDGTDAVMLSDESANGKYPVEACETLGKIAAATEPYMPTKIEKNFNYMQHHHMPTPYAVGRAACWLAEDMNAAAIIAYTKTGFTAYAVSQFRPSCPIIALTPSIQTCQQLTLCWGTTPVETPTFTDTDEMFLMAVKVVMDKKLAKKGDKLVLIAGIPLGIVGATNLIKIVEV